MIKNYILVLAITMFFFFSFVGCGEALEKPLVIEETTTVDEQAVIDKIIQISPEDVFEIVNDKESFDNYILLDVRTIEEFKEGHIKDSIHIPLSELEDRITEIEKDKSIIVYCRSGARSMSASKILVENGFGKVYNMQGGILKWESDGYPVEK